MNFLKFSVTPVFALKIHRFSLLLEAAFIYFTSKPQHITYQNVHKGSKNSILSLNFTSEKIWKNNKPKTLKYGFGNDLFGLTYKL